jgi:hypothetical protein
LLIYPVCLLALEGCADLAVAESTATVDWKSPATLPWTIRTLDADNRFSQVSSVAAAERLRALHPEEPLNILALSGGGAYGAFGAGAVAGLTRAGSRPDFAVVTDTRSITRAESPALWSSAKHWRNTSRARLRRPIFP